ncbi:MAG TPA: CDP-alcohol phosphatidyltransferase family protein [Anaerolineales bacterium]|nr:CDP-alcohol phosphatidyltransferase family protein [Anaerolineales bacterium]HLO31125.1 CDP-alcohol phosphatidyltransferase family protein [Anaerolineales bacterium]
MIDISHHRRVNDILLGPLERPTLRWLAAHMPAWITPDICTIIGVLGAVEIAISYTLSIYERNFLWLASFGFIVHWFGDSLDGTLARYRHIERPIFGFFVDHITDAFSALVIFLGLGLTPYVSFNIASLTLIAYLLLCVLVFIRTGVAGEFKISYSKLGPTEIRVCAILLNTTMYFGGVRASSLMLGNIARITFTPYDLIVAMIALVLLGFFLVTAIREIISLAKENK